MVASEPIVIGLESEGRRSRRINGASDNRLSRSEHEALFEVMITDLLFGYGITQRRLLKTAQGPPLACGEEHVFRSKLFF